MPKVTRPQVTSTHRSEKKEPAKKPEKATEHREAKSKGWGPKVNNDEAIRRWRERNTGPIAGSGLLGPGFGGSGS